MSEKPAIDVFSENALKVLQTRYFAKNDKGEVVEDLDGLIRRVSVSVAAGEPDSNRRAGLAAEFGKMLRERRFLPNTPTLINAGRELGQLSACFVLPLGDSMEEIFDTVKNVALIQKSGGGTGISFSRLRPENSIVKSTGGRASGPISFMKVINAATDAVKQGGCLVPETLVFTKRGLLRLDEIVSVDGPEWQKIEEKVLTDDGWHGAYEGHVHGISECLSVELKNGARLTGTPEHKILVKIGESFEWKTFNEIRTGDLAVLPMGQASFPDEETLLRPLVGERHFNEITPSFPATLNDDLAFFFGYFYGNGHKDHTLTTKSIGWTVPDKRPDIKHKLRTFVECQFGLHVSSKSKADNASETFTVASTAFYDWLEINGFQKNRSYEIAVPRKIRQSPISVVGAFIRGYFEADGTLNDGHPIVTSTSRRFLEEIQTLLSGAGIYSVLHEIVQPQGTERNRFGDRPIYSLCVRTSEALKKFNQIVRWTRGIQSGRKNGDVRGEQHGCTDIGPDILLKTLDSIKGMYGYGVYRALYRAMSHFLDKDSPGFRNLTRGAMSRIVKHFGKILQGTALMEQWEAQKNVWFVPVKAVSAAGQVLTLDLSVENRHAYTANGVVSHNTRRGANMGILRVDHPDVLAFVDCKQDLSELTNFNISVAVTDAFMKALDNGSNYDLVDPSTGQICGSLSAKMVWDKICANAWKTGEPGLFFIDTANKFNPTPSRGTYEATNPCGEQVLGPYESCTLGSINLERHVVDGKIDWDSLAETTRLATVFLDDVVNVNKFPLEKLAEQNAGTRRIGLGVMGFARMLMKLGIPYDSEEGLATAETVMDGIRKEAMATSIDRGTRYGIFPFYEGVGPKRRNSHILSIAPTGTISMIADTSSGCEPEFALVWYKNVMDGTHLPYALQLFEDVAKKEGFWSEDLPQKIVENHGSCRGIDQVPEKWQKVFATAHDIAPEWHVRMQAAFQKFVDTAVSKTINLPDSATPSDVDNAYRLAYSLGCKGITVYRDGSRQNQVLNVGTSVGKKEAAVTAENGEILPWGTRKKSSGVISGGRIPVKSHHGKAYVHLYLDEGGTPQEIFVTPATGHEEKESAILLGRLGSLALQYGAPYRDVVSQFIKAHEEAGTMGSDVHMTVKALGQLYEELSAKAGRTPEVVEALKCPECRIGRLSFQEGCQKCTTCGFSKC